MLGQPQSGTGDPSVLTRLIWLMGSGSGCAQGKQALSNKR